jgi:DNA polymerase III epsilon subunit-like protein
MSEIEIEMVPVNHISSSSSSSSSSSTTAARYTAPCTARLKRLAEAAAQLVAQMPCPPAVEAAINNVEETDDADINDLMDNFNGMQVDLTTEECEDDALDRAGVGDNDSEFDEEENREQEDEAAGKEGEEGDEGDGDEGNGMSAATIQESSTDETVKKLPKYSFLKEEYSLPPSNPVYVVFDIETNGISSMLNKRMCSIAAQVFDKDGVLISVDTKSDFNSKIQIDRKMHPKWGTGIHGMTYKELEKERLFGPVFDSFLAFIEARRGASSEVVLVAHNGVTCDFRLLLVEMARHERVFPATLNIHLYDTYAAIKKCKANKSLDYWTASVEDWPKRGAKSKGYMEHGTPKMQVPCIVNFILKKRAKFAPNEDTFESYCGAAHDALADVKGLALITFDPEGLGKKIKLKHYYGPLVVGHLLEYADKLIKHENFVEADPCMQGWTEKKEDEEGCPLEEKEDPDFTPKEGCAENGGPSRLLREYMGMGEGDKYAPCTSWEETAAKVFRFYFDDDVLQLMIDAWVSKASQVCLVVVVVVVVVFSFLNNSHSFPSLFFLDQTVVWVPQEGSSRCTIRAPKEGDDLSWKRGLRCKILVDLPPTKGEALAFVASIIWMGQHRRRRITHYWDTSNLELGHTWMSGTFKQTRYLKLLALWSFELVGGGNPGDPIRKFRRFDLMVMARIQEAWDIEAHITLDEARIKMFSKFCPFTWTMMCKPIRHGCTVYVLAFPESGYVYGWVWWTGKGMAKTHGQPTDQRAVNEDETSGEHGFMRILIETLFTEEDFWHTQIMTWMDKAFTSNANCRWFDDHGMGNAGPCRAFRPKNMKKTPEYYWAFGEDFSKKGGREQRYEKGWYRIAYTKLPSGKYLSNIAWLDNRFVTFVSNRLHDCSPDQVKRWSRANRKREWRNIHRAIKMYGEKMGAVDGVNQAAAKADCTVPRAQLNFYRKMGAKTVDMCRHNAIAAAASLYQGYDALRKSKKWKGWPTFANISLATALLNMGIQMDKDALGTTDVREREGLVPAWMNGRSGMKKRHRSDAPAPVKRRAVVHEWVDLKTIVLEWDQSQNPTKYHPPQGRCRGCLNNAGKGKANSVKKKCKGCKQCKVALCEECHKDSTKWNHQSHRSDAPAPVKRRAVVHEWVDLKTIVLEWDQSQNPTKYHPPQGRCRGCLNNAGKGKANSVKKKYKGCKQCKVALCEECHKDSTKWNHQSKRAPPVISVA